MTYQIRERIKVKPVQLEGVVENIELMSKEWHDELRNWNHPPGRYFKTNVRFDNPKYGGSFSIEEECVHENDLGVAQTQIGSLYRKNFVIYGGKLFHYWKVPYGHGSVEELVSPIDSAQIRAYQADFEEAERYPTQRITDRRLPQNPFDVDQSPVRHYYGSLDFFRDLSVKLGENQHAWIAVDSSFRDCARYLLRTGPQNPLRKNDIRLSEIESDVYYGNMPISVLEDVSGSFLDAIPFIGIRELEGSVHIDYSRKRVSIAPNDKVDEQKWIAFSSALQDKGIVSEYHPLIKEQDWPRIGKFDNLNRKKVLLNVISALEDYFKGDSLVVNRILVKNRTALETVPKTFQDDYLYPESTITHPYFTLRNTQTYPLISITQGGLETTAKLCEALRDFTEAAQIITYFMEVK